jgi:hypothetical protein
MENRKAKCEWCDKEVKQPSDLAEYKGVVYVVCQNCGEQTALNKESDKRNED